MAFGHQFPPVSLFFFLISSVHLVPQGFLPVYTPVHVPLSNQLFMLMMPKFLSMDHSSAA